MNACEWSIGVLMLIKEKSQCLDKYLPQYNVFHHKRHVNSHGLNPAMHIEVSAANFIRR
jgi:hypothetical protein